MVTAIDGSVYAGTLEGGLHAVRLFEDGTLAEPLRLGTRFRRGDVGLPDAISVAPDGSFHLVDEAIDRVPPGAREADVHRPQGDTPRQVNALIAFSSDTLLIQGLLASAGGAHLYHVYSHVRGFLRSFGDTDDGIAFVQSFAATRRRIARYGASKFVSVRPNRYELQVWRLDGTLEQTVRPNSTWFRSWSQREVLPDIRTGAWPTIIQGVSVDSLGLAWVVGWRPKSAGTPFVSTTHRLTRSVLESRVEAVIELLDLRCQGKLVLRSVVPHALQGFVGEGVSMIADFDEVRKEPAFRLVRFKAELSPYLRTRARSCSPGVAP